MIFFGQKCATDKQLSLEFLNSHVGQHGVRFFDIPEKAPYKIPFFPLLETVTHVLRQKVIIAAEIGWPKVYTYTVNSDGWLDRQAIRLAHSA